MSPLEFMQRLAALVRRRRQLARGCSPDAARERLLRSDRRSTVNVAEGSGAPVRSLELQTFDKPSAPLVTTNSLIYRFGDFATANGRRTTSAVP
jgi:hypothetical protein